MRRSVILFILVFFGFQLSAQQFFSATAASADEGAHLRFMKMYNSEYEKRSAIWKVPSTTVRIISSVQSGAGYLSGYNYGAVLPAPEITKYSKFSKTDDFDLVACSKSSRGIEAIALALSIMNTNTGGALKTDEDYLQHVFGAGGELALMATEAEKAYRAYTKKDIYLDSGYTAPSATAGFSSPQVQPVAPMVEQSTTITDSAPTPNLMIKEKEVEHVVETEVSESVSSSEFIEAIEAEEEVEVVSDLPVVVEQEVQTENGLMITSKVEEVEVDAQGRRIIKDPNDNINKIETYETQAAGSKIVKKLEKEEKVEEAETVVEESNVASQDVDAATIAKEQSQVDKQLEATNRQQDALKMAAKTEAEKREAEILKAEQLIIQQRKEMAERRAKKAAAAAAKEKAGGGN